MFVFMETGNFIFPRTHILLFIKVELNTALLMVRFLSTYLAVYIRVNIILTFLFFFKSDLLDVHVQRITGIFLGFHCPTSFSI